MAYQTILYEVDGRIAFITLNRPEKLNALSVELQKEVVQALHEAEADDNVRVIVVRGMGRAFSAGYDISPSPQRGAPISPAEDRARLEETLRRWFVIWELGKPVIAQVHGYCLAGATQLAFICDITIAAEDTRFGIPQLPLGAGFVSQIWAWLAGPKKAKEIFYRVGSMIDAREAERLGLINRAVPAADLESEVRATAEAIAATPTELLGLLKLAINKTQDVQGFREAMFFGCEVDAIAHKSDSVLKVNQLIRERGLREALETWRQIV